MHLSTRSRHALAAPAVLTALLATTTLATVPAASAAISPEGQNASAADQQLPPYRVVPGVELKVKPPAFHLPVQGYHLTGRFGQSSGLWASTHTGLDFAAPEGTEIRSVAAGTVTAVGFDGAYGNKTEITLADGTVLWYCHQSDTAVSVGQRVAADELIGNVGSTGNVTGPHLHLEVHPGGGDPIDPEAWLPTHGLHP